MSLKRILIADDCRPVRQFVRMCIESRPGLQVCGEAADGVEAVERAAELKPDLIVLDLAMPRMNGLQVAAHLKNGNPKIPIILYTSHHAVVSADQAQSMGINAVVSKAGAIEVLLEEVNRLLVHSKAAAAS